MLTVGGCCRHKRENWRFAKFDLRVVKKSTLETTESDDFDLAYYKERIERLEAEIQRLQKTIKFLRTTIIILSNGLHLG